MITPAAVSDKYKINASLARKALKEMARQKLIRRVVVHNGLHLYTRTEATIKEAEQKASAAAAAEAKKAAAKGGKAAPAAAAPAKGGKKEAAPKEAAKEAEKKE